MISVDLFGTLVTVDRPADPAAAVGRELSARGIDPPHDWADAYVERHVDAPAGAEVPLPAHVAAALASRGVDPRAGGGAAGDDGAGDGAVGDDGAGDGDPARDGRDGGADSTTAEGNAVRRAVVAAFDPTVERRPGAREVLAAAAERGPVGLLSNCAVPELVGRTLVRADLRDAVDVVVTSAGCGWRKPDARAFEALARRLDCPVADLIHVGDDPRTDGGIVDAGGRFVRVIGPDDGTSQATGGDDPVPDPALTTTLPDLASTLRSGSVPSGESDLSESPEVSDPSEPSESPDLEES